MAWIMDTYSMMHGHSVPAVVTGKPVSIGGSSGRIEATGRGVLFIAAEACRRDRGVALEGARVAVQGFGNVGSVAAKLLNDAGAKIVAISDSDGGLYNAGGLGDIDEILALKHERGFIPDGARGARITNAELLELPVDILIPAALEGQIHGGNAARIQAPLIIEAANGPTTPEADRILNAKGAYVVPDILANAGGVIVSYFEWVQDLQSFFWGRRRGERQAQAHHRARVPRGRRHPRRARVYDARSGVRPRCAACRRGDAGARDLPVAADGYSRQRHRAQRDGCVAS